MAALPEVVEKLIPLHIEHGAGQALVVAGGLVGTLMVFKASFALEGFAAIWTMKFLSAALEEVR